MELNNEIFRLSSTQKADNLDIAFGQTEDGAPALRLGENVITGQGGGEGGHGVDINLRLPLGTDATFPYFDISDPYELPETNDLKSIYENEDIELYVPNNGRLKITAVYDETTESFITKDCWFMKDDGIGDDGGIRIVFNFTDLTFADFSSSYWVYDLADNTIKWAEI